MTQWTWRNQFETPQEYTTKACAASRVLAVPLVAQLGLTCPQDVPDAVANFVEPPVGVAGPCKMKCVHADWRLRDKNVYSQ